MFKWYSPVKMCYVYLPDVSSVKNEFQEGERDEKTRKNTKWRIESLEHSDWFTRGWTLQELLAPTELYFFDRYWRLLGSKATLSAQIQRVTGIEARYINGDVSKACIAVKMSWLAPKTNGRNREHGILHVKLFGINTFIRYGEGEAAFLRLGQELIRQRPTDESIFAWKSPEIGLDIDPGPLSCGLLAPWPTCYLGSENVTIESLKYMKRKGYYVTGGGIKIQAPNKLPENGNAADWMALVAAFRRHYWLKLNCWGHNDKFGIRNTITIHLHEEGGNWRRKNNEVWGYR